MLEKFLKQTSFQNNEDHREHLEFIVPERFNFAYDVMDAWAEECPDALALWWVNDKGGNRRISFGEMPRFWQRIKMALSFVALAGENLYQGMSENGRKSQAGTLFAISFAFSESSV